MKHPFETLKPEYTHLLAVMTVRPECAKRLDEEAHKILGFRDHFAEVQKAIGVPVLFTGPSFYREAGLDFSLSPAQGDPWRKVSHHVPAGLGPYKSWLDAAIAAYRGKGLDKIKVWTWELICFYAELFNGMGYRDVHHEHSPYLWGGTNIQTIGKYTSDDHFEEVMDTQLGVIPLARTICQIAPEFRLSTPIPVLPSITRPVPSGLAPAPEGVAQHGVEWLQTMLKKIGYEISIDGSYGAETKHVVATFQRAYGLIEDGYAGPQTMAAVKQATDLIDAAPQKESPPVLPTSHGTVA